MAMSGLSPRQWRRGCVIALGLLAAVLATPVHAVNVGYYDMSLGAGNANQVAPITAAGHTAVNLTDLQAANLSGIKVLFVQNPSNSAYGAEYLSRLASIEAAVSNGMVLILHDRFVTNAATILPGGSGITFTRDLTTPGSNDINALDATSPVVSGTAGTLTDTSLDGGSFSSHGYASAATLPAGAQKILWRPDPGNAASRDRIVNFAYAHGNGAVIYSSIPLDLFLNGSGPNPPRANFTGVYAPNVVAYGALLSGGAPDLSISITDGRADAIPGEPVTYTVQAGNAGIGAAVGARVIIDLSAFLTSPTWTCAASVGSTCPASGSGDVNELVDITVGGTVTFTLTGTVASSATGTLVSTASIQAPTGQTDPVAANNSATDTDVLTPQADLVVSKAGPATATPGGNVAYTLTVRNAGPSDAAAVTLSDPTPTGLTFVSATSPCASGFPCNLGAIAAGGQVTVTATWSVPSPYLGPDPVINLAAARSNTPDLAPANNTARATTPAGGTASADLRVLASGPPSAALGSTVTYTLRVQNLGPHDAAGVSLQHTPPAGLFLLSISAPCAGGFPCALGTLNAGAEQVVRVTFGIPAGFGGGGPLAYSATVSATTADPAAGNNTGNASVPLGADTADLTVKKTGSTTVALGGNVSYTIVVTNQGPAAATNVLLTDATPAGLTFVSANAPCVSGFPCNLGTLASGASVTIRSTYLVPGGYSGANPIQNTASVAADQTEGNTADNSSTVLTGVGNEAADVSVTKSGPGAVAAGTELTYTLLVVNHGPGTATGVTLGETAPGTLTYLRADAPCAGGLPCSLGDLPAGTSLAVGVTYRVAANHVTPNPLVNTATVSTTGTDPVSANDSSQVSTDVVYRADLQVTKTDGITQVSPGFAVTYTITVTNAGPSDVAGATVTDTFPSGLTNVSWTCSVTAGGAGASCTAAGSGNIADTVNLVKNATVTYTVQATVAAGASGTVVNTASAAVPAGVADPVPGNNSATDTDTVLLPVDLVMAKAGPATATAGTNVSYTLTVTNDGPGTATAVSLADPTPTGLTFVSATAPCAGGFPCALPNLASGQNAQVTVTFAVPAGYSGPATIANVATVSNATPESDPADNSATANTTVAFSSNLGITKTDGRSTVVPGEGVTYTIVVTNAGPSDATGARAATVTDTPPAALLSPSWTCAAAGGATCTAAGTGAIAQSVGLPVGGSLTYTLNATVDPAAATAVVNQATVAVAAGATDPTPGNNTASDTSGLAPTTDLAVLKSDGQTAAVPGEPLTYSVFVGNNGPSDVVGATLTDTLPAALTSATWTCTGDGATCPATSGSGNLAETISLPAGSGLTYLITGTVDASATGTLSNTATAAVPAGVTDPTSANNSATDAEPLTRVAALSLTQTGPGTVSRGAQMSVTFKVTNAGPSAAAVELTAPVPAGLTLVSAGAPCSGVAGGFPCSLGTIAPGGEVQLTATYSVPAGYAGADPVIHLSGLKSDASDPDPSDNAGRSATAVGRAGVADLSIIKESPSVAATGSTVTYLLTVINDGPDDAVGVSLNDTFPAGLTFVSATAPCEAGFLCNLGTLAAGASRSVELTLAIPADYAGNSLLVNQASVTATTGDPDASDNSASANTTLVASAIDLEVTKTGPVQVDRGGSATYTITVTNHGPSTATNVTLADPTPPFLTRTGSTAPCTAGFPCFLDTLASGQSVTVQVTFQVPPGYSGSNPIANTASITANELDARAGNDSATSFTGVDTPAADVEVTVSGPAQGLAGSTVSYEILVRNLGPGTAKSVSLAAPAPTSSTFVSATSPCAGGFPCALGDLPSGSAIAVLATYRPASNLASGTVVTLSASHSASSVDPQGGNGADSANTTLGVQADLGITKADSFTSVAPGQPVIYTITVTNHGPSDAPGTRVIDSFSNLFNSVSWTCAASAGSSCAPGAAGTGDIDRTVSIAAGGTVTYTATANIAASSTGSLVNTATVQAPAGVPDPVAGNDSATDTDTLTPQADLEIFQSDGTTSVVPGLTVTYTITVLNSGPSDAPGTVVTDTFSTDLSGVTWTCTASAGSTCTASGSGQILDTILLRANGSVVYTATGTLSSAATQPLVNTATVAAGSGVTDPSTLNNSTTDTNTLNRQANLSLTKDDGVTAATPGATVNYTIVAANAGPSDVTGATVTDTFPAAVTAVSWTCSASGGAQCNGASGTGNIAATVNLPAGGSVTYTASATINAAATGNLVNTALVSAPAGVTDPVPGNNTDDDTDTLSGSANLAIIKSTLLSAAVTGEPVTYTLLVSNAGPSNSAGVTVTDDLPATLLDATWTCTADGGASCAASGSGDIQETVSLPAGGTVSYTVTATLSRVATGTLTNTATVTAPAGAPDPTPANNTSTVALPIITRPLDYFTLTPCRLVDTRQAAGPLGGPALTSGVDRTFVLAGPCGVPSSARAVAINVTVVAPDDTGHIQLFPTGVPAPSTSVINFSAGKTRANNAILPLGDDGAIKARSFLIAGGAVHVLVDVVGYFE